MSVLDKHEGQAKADFRKAAENVAADKGQSGGRGDNTQHAGKAGGPGHAKGDEWAAARKEVNQKLSQEKGAQMHNNALNKGPEKENKGPSR